MEDAAYANNLKLLKELFFEGYSYNSDLYYGALLNSNIDMLEWLSEIKCPFPSDILSAAVQCGDLDVIKWVYQHENCPKINENQRIFTAAAANGNLENMKWLYEKGVPFDDTTYSAAVDYGKIGNMRWLFEKGCRP